MEHLIECLKSFNSKERFFLLGHVFDNPAFLISSKFRRELEGKLDIIISEDAFAAMDYHLDWLYASLIWAEDYEKKGEPYLKNDIIEGNQEDIDFIIAFDDESISHLIFVEAKGEIKGSSLCLAHTNSFSTSSTLCRKFLFLTISCFVLVITLPTLL